MSRVHDMGGRFGDGPVVPGADDASPFKTEWEKRAHALVTASMPLGGWNIDQRRHGRERLAPKDYARFSYYEKWLAGLADMLVEGGILTADELASGDVMEERPDLGPLVYDPAKAPRAGTPYDRPGGVAPRFAPGDQVLTRRAGNLLVPGGHTRLPGYAAKARGRILRYHGTHVFPDANAHGLGERPEPLYAVVFAASELWEAPEHPGDEVVCDLWDSYLEPVT